VLLNLGHMLPEAIVLMQLRVLFGFGFGFGLG
jgi:hypothetical protein